MEIQQKYSLLNIIFNSLKIRMISPLLTKKGHVVYFDIDCEDFKYMEFVNKNLPITISEKYNKDNLIQTIIDFLDDCNFDWYQLEKKVFSEIC